MSEIEKATILIVDDQVENIDILRGALQASYKILVALTGLAAIELAQRANPDIILLDIMMPEMDGYEVCSHLKKNVATASIPIIFVTAMSDEQNESKGLKLGAVDYITKPISTMIVKQRIKTQLELRNQHLLLENRVQERTQQLELSQLEVVYRLGRAAEYKDNQTGLHVQRVSKYSYTLAKAANLPELECNLLLNSAAMHDIGKIGIPDTILLKPGKLDKQEWDIMTSHVEIGGNILSGSDSPLMNMASEIALSHHEKWDGSGYPNQLSQEAIPLVGRIVAVADVFDALTAERPYKKAWPVEDAVNLINEESGKHFDPTIVQLFNEHLETILSIKNELQDT